MTKKPTKEEMHKLLLAALRSDIHQRFALITKSDEESGFHGDGDRTPEIVQLLQLHQEWLIRQLKDNMVVLHWNDWDDHALASIMPVETRDAKKKFDTFKLKFPPRKPALVISTQ
jgi:hypothetical protein